MGIKIHDQAADDLEVTVPDGWPALNVSGLQGYRSLEKKTDPVLLQNLMRMAAEEVTENFDSEVLVLPLEGSAEISFKYAVYELAFSKLLPLLPVHNQLDSEKADPQAVQIYVRSCETASLAFQRRIPGFKSIVKKRISSAAV
jgi:hypothetical protein